MQKEGILDKQSDILEKDSIMDKNFPASQGSINGEPLREKYNRLHLKAACI